MRKYLLGIAALAVMALAGSPVFAQSVCPGVNGGNSGGETPNSIYVGNLTISGGVVTGNTGCTVLITFGSGGSVATTNPNGAVSYDEGLDDSLVGIVNNSGATITSLALNGGSGFDIFGFDGDGVCGALNTGAGGSTPGYTFVGGGNPCGLVDSTGYGDNGITFAGINTSTYNSGDVVFPGAGLANGATAFFSLEGPVDENLTVGPAGTPEPGSLMLLASGLMGLGLVRRRKLTS